VISLHLVDDIFGANHGLLRFLGISLSLLGSHFPGQKSLINSAQVVASLSPLYDAVIHQSFLLLHLLELLLLLLRKHFLIVFHIFLLLLAEILVDVLHEAVGQDLVKDLLLLLILEKLHRVDGFSLTIHGPTLDLPGDNTFLLAVLFFNVGDLFLASLVQGVLLCGHLFNDLGVDGLRDDGFDSAFAILFVLADDLLLSKLLLHHRQDLFLQLDRLLLVKLQEQIFEFLLVLLVNETFDGSWNLFICQLELHLADYFLKSFLAHLRPNHLVVVRVSKGVVDPFLKLVRLHASLLLDRSLTLSSASGKFVGKSLVLILGFSTKLILHFRIDFLELLQESCSLVFRGSLRNLLVDEVTLVNQLSVGVEGALASKFSNLFINFIVFLNCFLGGHALFLALLPFMNSFQFIFATPLLFHLIHQNTVAVELFVKTVGKLLILNLDLLITSLQSLLHLLLIFDPLPVRSFLLLLELLELLVTLELGGGLSLGTTSLEISVKLVSFLVSLLLELRVNLELGILVLIKHFLELLLRGCILQTILVVAQLVLLLDSELSIQSLPSLRVLNINLSELLLQFFLKFRNNSFLQLLFGLFILFQILFDFAKFLLHLLSAKTSLLQSTFQDVVLTVLISEHHVLNALDLALELVHVVLHVVIVSTILVESVLEILAAIESRLDLLLENLVVFLLEFSASIFSIIFQLFIELVVVFLLLRKEIFFTLLVFSLTSLLLFLEHGHLGVHVHCVGVQNRALVQATIILIVISTKHLATLQNKFLECSNLLVKFFVFFIFLIIGMIVREVAISPPLSARKLPNLSQMLLQVILQVLNLVES